MTKSEKRNMKIQDGLSESEQTLLEHFRALPMKERALLGGMACMMAVQQTMKDKELQGAIVKIWKRADAVEISHKWLVKNGEQPNGNQ